ncbi:MAG: P1 family peptidase [Devosiaceae bacterium]
MWKSGPTNSVADIRGLVLGHAHNEVAKSGTSVIIFDEPTIASVAIHGQAPGTRETELLHSARTVQKIDALVLSGGSAFGLAAADSVMAKLAKDGRGFAVGDARVPIVPAAILFDLTNGGKKPEDLGGLYRELGTQAFEGARHNDQSLGQIGAGFGASTGASVGGLGVASCIFTDDVPEDLQGHTVAAMVAVNAVGSPFVDGGPHFRAAPFELDGEYGGLGMGEARTPATPRTKLNPAPCQNTTIGAIITSVPLTKPGCHSLAIAGQDGITAAIYPAHTALDGDLVFAASTGTQIATEDLATLVLLQAATTATMARAIARGVYSANNTSPSQS